MLSLQATRWKSTQQQGSPHRPQPAYSDTRAGPRPASVPQNQGRSPGSRRCRSVWQQPASVPVPGYGPPDVPAHFSHPRRRRSRSHRLLPWLPEGNVRLLLVSQSAGTLVERVRVVVHPPRGKHPVSSSSSSFLIVKNISHHTTLLLF